ncbi:hypothetical protein JCM18750_00270 [Halostagnicola bangensis]
MTERSEAKRELRSRKVSGTSPARLRDVRETIMIERSIGNSCTREYHYRPQLPISGVDPIPRT